jgi:hypothetical protein|tara:strand:- start:164 stop:751 length:588 start_codon:yes stop_codon:yes gene_type:complete
MVSHQELSRLCAESYTSSDFEEANIEVIVKSYDDGVAFAFRGTDEPWDVATDIRCWPWYVKEVGFAPRGFALAARRMLPKVMSWCLEHDIDPKDDGLILTGHSLGGSVALLVASLACRHELYPKQVVTFGAPKSGRLKILEDNNIDVSSYRNGRDIVPMVPPLARRHGKLIESGEKNGLISDHYAKQYVRMKKHD